MRLLAKYAARASALYREGMMTFFKNMFGDPHQSERARDKLFSIKQGKKNIRTFVMEFNELLLLSSSSLDEDTKITMFRRSLDIKL